MRLAFMQRIIQNIQYLKKLKMCELGIQNCRLSSDLNRFRNIAQIGWRKVSLYMAYYY